MRATQFKNQSTRIFADSPFFACAEEVTTRKTLEVHVQKYFVINAIWVIVQYIM